MFFLRSTSICTENSAGKFWKNWFDGNRNNARSFHYDMFVVAKKAGKRAAKISSGALKSTVVIDGLIFRFRQGQM